MRHDFLPASVRKSRRAYDFTPVELRKEESRDDHGRWTSGGRAMPPSLGRKIGGAAAGLAAATLAGGGMFRATGGNPLATLAVGALAGVHTYRAIVHKRAKQLGQAPLGKSADEARDDNGRWTDSAYGKDIGRDDKGNLQLRNGRKVFVNPVAAAAIGAFPGAALAIARGASGLRGAGKGAMIGAGVAAAVNVADSFRARAANLKVGNAFVRKLFSPPPLNFRATISTISDVQKSAIAGELKDGLVYGWASIVEKDGEMVTDHQGDRVPVDELVKTAHDFIMNSRVGGAMHLYADTEDKVPLQAGDVVESLVFTHDLQKALGINLPHVGWLIGYQITDPDVKKMAAAGTLKSFSIGGSGFRSPAED